MVRRKTPNYINGELLVVDTSNLLNMGVFVVLNGADVKKFYVYPSICVCVVDDDNNSS